MNPTTSKENYTPGTRQTRPASWRPETLKATDFSFYRSCSQALTFWTPAAVRPRSAPTSPTRCIPGKVTALDISPSELDHGRRLAEGREILNLEFLAGSAYEIPFPDSSFNVVFSHALLEHLSEPRRALKEFYRVTRPGGFVALWQPGLGCL